MRVCYATCFASIGRRKETFANRLTSTLESLTVSWVFQHLTFLADQIVHLLMDTGIKRVKACDFGRFPRCIRTSMLTEFCRGSNANQRIFGRIHTARLVFYP